MSESNIKSVGVKPCPTHANYKGRRPTKRDCPHCKKLYDYLQAKSRDTKPFRSLLASDFRVSMFHVLSEFACYQRFGKLPPYFWRKGTQCPQKAKDHYNKTYKMLMAWQKKRIPAKNGTWNPLEALNQVFYYLSGHDAEMDELTHKKVKLIQEPRKTKRTTEAAMDFGDSKKKNRFQSLKDLGGNNGEE